MSLARLLPPSPWSKNSHEADRAETAPPSVSGATGTLRGRRDAPAGASLAVPGLGAQRPPRQPSRLYAELRTDAAPRGPWRAGPVSARALAGVVGLVARQVFSATSIPKWFQRRWQRRWEVKGKRWQPKATGRVSACPRTTAAASQGRRVRCGEGARGVRPTRRWQDKAAAECEEPRGGCERCGDVSPRGPRPPTQPSGRRDTPVPSHGTRLRPYLKNGSKN